MAVHFILHVPKTAGITIAEHLEENCARGVLWRPQRRFGPLPGPDDPARVGAVALSHYHGRSLERFFDGREIRRIVLLRDPVSLQISYYNWRMMQYLSRGLGTYSFDLHLRTLPRNYMTNFLLRRWLEIPLPLLAVMPDSRKLELVQRSLAQFWYVGRHSDTDRLIEALAPALHVPPVAIPRNGADEWRQFVTWTPFTIDQLTPEAHGAILADHALDQLLWENWGTARFDVRAVSPRGLPADARNNPMRALLRPVHEAARLWQRGIARPYPKVPVKPLAVGQLRDEKAKFLLEALVVAPQSRAAWRDYLTHARRAPQSMGIAPDLAGPLEAMHDPVLCLLKAEALLVSGHAAQARQFLRLAPALAVNRRQARDIVQRATVLDSEFRQLVLQADQARDRRVWREAADFYQDALDLHPGHFGYRLQYSNCLKELGDYAGAEIQCRSARALGASLQDIGNELNRVAAMLGYEEPADGLAKRRLNPASASLLDDPPTQADVDLASEIATGASGTIDTVLAILRRDLSIRAVINQLAQGNPLPETEQVFLARTRMLAIAAAQRPA